MDDRWQALIDKNIRDVIGDGNLSHLPNAGKPLQLEDDSNVPPDLRLAHKILKDNNLTPPWIGLGQEIDSLYEKLLTRLQTAYRVYQGRVGDAIRAGDVQAKHDAEDKWHKKCAELEELFRGYNGKVLDYTLTAPKAVTPKRRLDFDRELKKIIG